MQKRGWWFRLIIKEFNMTLSQISSRIGALIGATAISTMLVFVAPMAHAAAAAPFYKVELAQPLAAPKNKLVKGSFFRCSTTNCTSTDNASSPKNMCIWVARDFGEVKSFQAGDRVFTADELAKCNKK
jgi:hypothetical protein